MPAFAIRAEGLGKRYRIGRRHQAYSTLRDTLLDRPARFLRRSDGEEPFMWALREVGFEVRHGEALAIVGRNGAGKSTLLKVLSRITEPTEGRAEVAGRVGSLLEVGTGFHQELTGRENVYLAGAVLGMRRADVVRHFDEIVEFSGVSEHLDTPVKYFSTGMYMRLAFAVAAHLEPDILIIDEVLAVGDAEFQKKCLGKMRSAASDGRTVLFVSHNMAAAKELCDSGLLLEHGRVAAYGAVGDVLSHYLSVGSTRGGVAEIVGRTKESMASGFRFTRIAIRNLGHEPSGRVNRTGGVEVAIEYRVEQAIRGCHIRLELWNETGTCIFETGNQDRDPFSSTVERPGTHEICCTIPADFLREGTYEISLYAVVPNVQTLDFGFRVISFDVVDVDSAEALLREGRRGVMYPQLAWREG